MTTPAPGWSDRLQQFRSGPVAAVEFHIGSDSRTWTLTPSAGLTRWLYKGPDPTINPSVTPRATEWRVGLGLDVPVWRALVFSMLVRYRAETANPSTFSTRDLAVSAGPTFKF